MSNQPLTKQTITNEQLDTLMHFTLEQAKKAGATAAMVSISTDRGFAVEVRMNEVETVAFHENKALKLLVFINNRKGSASSTDLSVPTIENLSIMACNIAKASAPDPCFGLPDPKLVSTIHPDLKLDHPWSITPSIAIEKALACEQQALHSDQRIHNSDGVHLSTYNFCNGFANTHGAKGIIHSSRHNISCSLIAGADSFMQRDYYYSTATDPTNLQSIEEVAQLAVERAISRLGARKLKTQKVPVLFSTRIASSLLSNFINAISGNNLYRKNSFLLDSINEQIFPRGFKIYEQPYLLGALGSASFDGEGVPTRNNVIIDNGKLCQYVLNSYSARKLGLETTANADGVHNLTIEANAKSLADLLVMMNKGLLVTELMGQGINGLTGDYSRGATGFWVEDGKIQFPVEEITIAGNLKDMFKNIIAVGNDLNPNIATRCGSVLIEEMMVAGH